MKKILILIFLVAISLSVFACDGEDGERGAMGLTGPSPLKVNQHVDVQEDASVFVCELPYHIHDTGGACIDDNECTADQTFDPDAGSDGECVDNS